MKQLRLDEYVMLSFAALAILCAVYLIGVACVGLATVGNASLQARLRSAYLPAGLFPMLGFFVAFLVSMVICTLRR
jgi:hypothetical protein